MSSEKIIGKLQATLKKTREDLAFGDHTNQIQLDSLAQEWNAFRNQLRPKETEEQLSLVDNQGKLNTLHAPRWLCHLLGLRHRSVHVLLKWQSPGMGKVFVLQIRNWEKSDSPGHIDISVGGHVSGIGSTTFQTAEKEMEEELGLTLEDLVGEELILEHSYDFHEEKVDHNFFNSEWREVYVGQLKPDRFEKIQFSDKEVVGLYLCPLKEARPLLTQPFLPIASALKFSLPGCL